MDHYIDRMMHSRARDVGGTLRSRLGLGPDDTVENLIILGTGFGESIAPDPSVKMRDLGLVFQDVGELHGHDRRAGLATVGGKRWASSVDATTWARPAWRHRQAASV